MTKFQGIVIGIIIILIFVAFLILSGALPGLPGRAGESKVELTFWGVLPAKGMEEIIQLLNARGQGSFSVKYVEKDEKTYERGLIDDLAAGSGPDMFFLTQDLILKHKNKVFLVPYSSFSERSFKDMFIDASELFLLQDGIVGLPFLVDPIVLYWNKDFFGKSGLVSPPRFWDDFLNYVINLTQKDRPGNILESGVALGEFENVNNAKGIFSMLVLQGGNEIIKKETLAVVFGEEGTVSADPAVNALTFYTSFSNPVKVSYSWNRALPSSKEMFIAGKLAMYFGYSSEYQGIREANPHLNFDIATVPQVKDSPLQVTFGKMYAVATSKNSPYVTGAFNAMITLATDKEIAGTLGRISSLPPARRDVLSKGTLDPISSVFYKAAIQTRAWLEPDSETVLRIFEDMIDSAVTGRKNASQSIWDARILIENEVRKVQKI